MTPWTVARRLLYSENSLGKNTGSVLLFPSPGHLPYPRIKPGSLILQADPLLSEPQNYNSKRYMYSNIHRSTFHNSKIWKQGTKLPTRRSNCQHLLDHRKSKGIKKKKIYFCFIDYTKAFDCTDHNKLENSKDGNTRPPYLSAEKPVCRTRSNSLNLLWNKGLVQNWERSMSKLCVVTLLI